MPLSASFERGLKRTRYLPVPLVDVIILATTEPRLAKTRQVDDSMRVVVWVGLVTRLRGYSMREYIDHAYILYPRNRSHAYMLYERCLQCITQHHFQIFQTISNLRYGS